MVTDPVLHIAFNIFIVPYTNCCSLLLNFGLPCAPVSVCRIPAMIILFAQTILHPCNSLIPRDKTVTEQN